MTTPLERIPSEGVSGSEGRALVVQDSPIQAEQLKRLLEGRGYAVTIVANGRQALAAAREDPPAVIISDIAMPEIDGYTLCRRIKSDEALKDIPVVLVTALSSPQDILRALECGADSLIRRPYDEHYLLARLRYIQANRELRGTEKVQMGVEIDIAGRRHFIDRKSVV